MEPHDTLTSNDPTHDADKGFDRGSGTRSNHNQGIQNEFESSQEDNISLNRFSDIFSSSSTALDEMHHDIMASSSCSIPLLPTPLQSLVSMPSLPTSPTVTSNKGGIGKLGRSRSLVGGGKLSDIFSSSTVERHHHDISSRSMSSLPSLAVTTPNNSRGGQSRMARMERPYNYVTSNSSHDTNEGFDRGTRICTSNQGIQNAFESSQEDNIFLNSLSDVFSSPPALDEMCILSSSPHSVSSLPTSLQSLLSMPSLPSTSPTVISNKEGIGKLRRSRSLASSSWNERFHELIQFREINDHCFVPRIYRKNPRLSQWVQKQRNQRKRKDQGLHSTLNDERQELLTIAGFCWDSNQALWKERFRSLEIFQFDHGHCIVPSNHPDTTFFNWVRYQRKQFKLYQAGSKSSMDEERVLHLISIGFK